MSIQVETQKHVSSRILARISVGCIALAIVYLGILHWQHIAPVLPALVLLACPLMHLLMHRHGHDHH
jgi:hypothetical protein